jgi:RNA polymerase sigma-32 factor
LTRPVFFASRDNDGGTNENAGHGIEWQSGEEVNPMRIATAYLQDGRGQTVTGRRTTTPGPVATLDLHDAADDDETLEAILHDDADDEQAADPLAAANDNEPAERRTSPTSGDKHDSYTTYMASLRDLRALDRDEEHELAVRYGKSHDKRIAEKLIASNLKLVVKLAHEYTRAHRNLLDLIQEGNVGLVQAVEKYDPHRGVKLSSYAAWWIRAYMLRYILQNARIVRLGTTATQRKLFFNLRKEQARLERMGFSPSAARVAKALNVPEAEVRDMEQRLAGPDASLDAPAFVGGDDDKARSRMDFVESPAARPDVIAEGDEFKERLHETLMAFGGKLHGRERALFEKRLINDAPRTLQQMGDEFGISRERTRQLEMRLMQRLKSHLALTLGDAIGDGEGDAADAQ